MRQEKSRDLLPLLRSVSFSSAMWNVFKTSYTRVQQASLETKLHEACLALVKLHFSTTSDRDWVRYGGPWQCQEIEVSNYYTAFLRLTQQHWIISFFLVHLRTFLGEGCQRRTRNRITFVLNSDHISFESGLNFLTSSLAVYHSILV